MPGKITSNGQRAWLYEPFLCKTAEPGRRARPSQAFLGKTALTWPVGSDVAGIPRKDRQNLAGGLGFWRVSCRKLGPGLPICRALGVPPRENHRKLGRRTGFRWKTTENSVGGPDFGRFPGENHYPTRTELNTYSKRISPRILRKP